MTFSFQSLLILTGVNINSTDNDGWTPLHAAAYWNKHDVIKCLMEQHVNFNIKNKAVRLLSY